MPQTPDPLGGRLSESYGRDLREFFAYYEIETVSGMYWRNRAPWKVDMRKCDDDFFLFPVVGSVRVTLASGSRLIAPGSYLALPKGERHALVIEKGCVRLEQIALHCHIQDRWRRPFLARFNSPTGRLQNSARWHRVLADLVCLMNSDPEMGRHLGKALVQELMADRLREGENLTPWNCNGDPRIEFVLQRMKKNLGSPYLSIEAMARETGLTATQMRKLFRRETQTSPKEYLQRLRLEKTAYLLRHSTHSVKQVASECGFATPNYFHLVFREAFGVTPTDFREKESL